MTTSNFFFPYTGRKKKFENENVYKHIDFKPITTIVEPFGGTMSFSQFLYMIKGMDTLHYIYNDLDTNMYNFFNYIHDEGMEGLTKLCNLSNNYKSTKKDKHIHKQIENIEEFFCIKAKGLDCPFTKTTIKKPERYNKHVEFIQQIDKIKNENYKVIFDKYRDRSDVLMYIDPPYMRSFNCDYMAQNDEKQDMTKIMVDIIELFKTSKCHIAYIHNKNALMDYLFKDFPPIDEYTKIYQITKKECIHSIRIK